MLRVIGKIYLFGGYSLIWDSHKECDIECIHVSNFDVWVLKWEK